MKNAIDTQELKYTRVEYERRFLVSAHADWKSGGEAYSKTFEDKVGLEDLMCAEPPAYAKHEVTGDPFFEGGNLCRIPRADLMRRLSMFG